MLHRRAFLRILAAVGAGGLVVEGGRRLLGKGPVRLGETRVLMGTIVNLRVVTETPGQARQAIEAVFQRMEFLESVLSRHLPESEVSRLNREGRVRRAHEVFTALVERSLSLSRLSGGAYDITVKPLLDCYQDHARAGRVPASDCLKECRKRVGYQHVEVDGHTLTLARPGMGITLDAIAKGYIVDEGVAVLRQHGLGNLMLEAGGDLMAAGGRTSGDSWKLGIASPRQSHPGTLASVALRDRAVATSGDYMQSFTPDFREHHILDPRTGHSSPELASATVTAPSACEADALATALMVLGPKEGLAMLGGIPGCEACLVTKDLEMVRSSGFESPGSAG